MSKTIIFRQNNLRRQIGEHLLLTTTDRHGVISILDPIPCLYLCHCLRFNIRMYHGSVGNTTVIRVLFTVLEWYSVKWVQWNFLNLLWNFFKFTVKLSQKSHMLWNDRQPFRMHGKVGCFMPVIFSCRIFSSVHGPDFFALFGSGNIFRSVMPTLTKMRNLQ